jgi:1,6-anhydro-N-acetylmuramate kinase
MAVEHRADALQSPTRQQLETFLAARHQAWQAGTPDFEQFERELHEHIMNLERECLAEELGRYDVGAEQIEVAGIPHRLVLQAAATYLSVAGPVRVERQLYRPAGRSAKSVCPLELRAGLIQGY